jgi:hypothetical protein
MIIPAGIVMFTCLVDQQQAVRGRSLYFTDPAAIELVAFI